MSWKARLLKPIIPAKGRPILTLDDARKYLLSLPADRHSESAVQTATHAVLMAAEGRGPIMHAHVGMAELINGPVAPMDDTKGADMTDTKLFRENAENCLHLAETTTDETKAKRYRRMAEAWRALADEQDWLDGEVPAERT